MPLRGRRITYETAGKGATVAGSVEEWVNAKQASELELLQSHVQAAAKAGQWQRALSLMEVLTQRRQAPTAKTYNASIAAVAKADDDGHQWERALLMVREMQSRRLRTDRPAYAATVNACSKTGAWQQAVALLAEMTSLHVRPDANCYTDVLQVCAGEGHWAVALELLRAAVQDGVKAEPHFVATMQACAFAGHWQRALDCLRHMPAQQLKPTAQCYGAAMTACDAAGKWAQVLSLLSTMESSRIAPDSTGYAAAASACQASGQRMRELELHSKMTDAQLAAVMDACVAGGRWTRAFKVLQGFQEAGKLPDASTLVATIRSCGRAGQWQNALGLLNALRVAGASAPPAAYSAAAKACADVGRWETVLKLLTAMECEELAPSPSMDELCKKAEEQLTAAKTAELVAAAARAMVSPDLNDACAFGRQLSLASAGGGDNRAIRSARPRLSTLNDDALEWEAAPSREAIAVLSLGGGEAMGFLPTFLSGPALTTSGRPMTARHARTPQPPDSQTTGSHRRRAFHDIPPEAGLQAQHMLRMPNRGDEPDSPLHRHINQTLEAAAVAQSHHAILGKKGQHHGHRRDRHMPYEAPLSLNHHGGVNRMHRQGSKGSPTSAFSPTSPRSLLGYETPRRLDKLGSNMSLGGMHHRASLQIQRASIQHQPPQRPSLQKRGSQYGADSLAVNEAPFTAAPPCPEEDEEAEDKEESYTDPQEDEAGLSSSLGSGSTSSFSDEEEEMWRRMTKANSKGPPKEPKQEQDEQFDGNLRESPILDRLRNAATTQFSNANWNRFIRVESSCGGEVKFWEFVRSVRECAKVGRQAVSDAELRLLFNHLDVEGSGSVPAEDLVAYLRHK
eukprot:CAMPEP_0178376722 /NCGR_PEP_ID=MMETSP0689_2-20121128/3549_1 /TAXON_ID=160604 /ORGANISM="Amphidinium massartii, Strain CS-259" /LENGTH=848 /DNA_ID=CAMNT_0019996753 /DNA_START=76 /DNA_END=2622 /DNA_ORIENTATION=+